MLNHSKPSLQKKYFFTFVLLVTLVLLGGSVYTAYVYKIFNEELNNKLLEVSENVRNELERGFNENTSILKYLGEIIVKRHISQDYDALSELLTSTGELNIRSLATSYVGWANEDGTILVSGKEGALPKPRQRSIIGRRYFITGRISPWILQFSEISQSLYSSKKVLPTAMGIQDKTGKFLGYLIIGLRLNQLTKHLKSNLSSAISFMIIDKDANLAIASQEEIFKEYKAHSLNLRKNLCLDTFGGYYFNQLGIDFLIVEPFREYPYKIIVGYNRQQFMNDFIQNISPKIIELLILAIISMILLYLFRKKIILPVMTLYEVCLKLSNGEKIGLIPKFKVQELDKLSEGLKFISDIIENSESKRKALENARDVFITSNQASERHYKIIFSTTIQYIHEIRMSLIILYEKLSSYREDKLNLLLDRLDKRAVDILNASYADHDIKPNDINALVIECKEIYLSEAFKRSIVVNTYLDSELPLCCVDQLEFKQVILSLMGHCLYRTPFKGYITVKTNLAYLNGNNYIQIAILCNGFAEEDIEKLVKRLDMTDEREINNIPIIDITLIHQIIEKSGAYLEKFNNESGESGYIMHFPLYIHNEKSFIDHSSQADGNIVPFKQPKP